jgi:hypothetical protein
MTTQGLAEKLAQIARKLETYAGVYTGDKEAREMAAWCRSHAAQSAPTEAQVEAALAAYNSRKADFTFRELRQSTVDEAAMSAALKASGMVGAVPEGWVMVKRSDRVERSWDGDEGGRYQHSCAACQRGFSGPKSQHLCRVCTEFPPVRHPADVERSRTEAMKLADQIASPRATGETDNG